MYHDEYGRTWQEPYPFSPAAIAAHAPAAFGVYEVLYTPGAPPQVSYIGIATGDTIRGRLQKHVRGRGNWRWRG